MLRKKSQAHGVLCAFQTHVISSEVLDHGRNSVFLDERVRSGLW
jgi:hypothetical protein